MDKKILELGEKVNLSKADVKKLSQIGLSGLLTLALSVFTFGAGDSNAAEANAQAGKDKAKTAAEKCSQQPPSSSCRSIQTGYFYDSSINRCIKFNYSTCDGEAPFNTGEECRAACVKKFPVSKYGGVGLRDFRDVK
jgi:hypothetical protein